MGKLISTAFAIGFAVLLERGVKTFLDKRDEKRAIAKASQTGFGSSTPVR